LFFLEGEDYFLQQGFSKTIELWLMVNGKVADYKQIAVMK
jgi:hypothetical protein